MASNHTKVFENPEYLDFIKILPLQTCGGCPFHPGKFPVDGWWGQGIKNGIDYIFLRSRDSGLQATMGGEGEIEFLKVLKKIGLESFVLGGCTLCRPRNGMIWPSNKEDKDNFEKAINHCRPNIETKIQLIINSNEVVGKKPPTIILLGKGAIWTFFPKLESSSINKFQEQEPYGLDAFPGAKFQASYDPTSSEAFFNQLVSYLYNLTMTEEKKITLLKNYHRIDTIEAFNELINTLEKKEIISFDIETSGLRYRTMKRIIEKKSKGHKTRTEDWDKDVIIGISFAHETRSGYYIPLYVKLKHFTNEHEEYIQNVSGDNDPFALTDSTTINDYRFWFGKKLEDYVYLRIKTLLENPDIKKVAQNGKFDCKFLKDWWGIDVKNFYWDTMLGSHVLNENTFNSLEFLSGNYPDLFNYKKKVKSKVSKISFEDESYADVNLNTLATYGGQDADLTLRLYYDQLEEIKKEKESKTKLPNDWVNSEWMMHNFYMPLSHFYTKAEMTGIYFDKEFAEETYHEYKESMKEMQSKIDAVLEHSSTPEHPIGPYDIKNSSHWINLNSPLQKQKLFYEDLGWPKFKETKAAKKKRSKGSSSHIKNEDASTDQDSLKQTLEYFYETDKVGKEAEIELIEWILEYSKKHKMINTYLKGKKLLNRLDENGFIHYIMKLHGTVCVSEDTEIIFKDKIRKIGKLIPKHIGSIDLSSTNLEVLTHKGRFKKVKSAVNKGIEEMILIKNDFGGELECTWNHQLMTIDGWKSVREILENDLTIAYWELPDLEEKPIVLKPNIEEYREIPEFPGYYVSNLGKVYTTKIPGGQGEVCSIMRSMHLRKSSGYNRIGLRNGKGKKKNFKVSNLVAELFIGPRPKKHIVDHFNCDRFCDWSTNLRYITPSENIKRGYKYSLAGLTRGEINGQNKLSIQEILRIKKLRRLGKFQAEIGDLLGVGQTHIGRICRGDSWNHLKESKLTFISSLGKKVVCDIQVEDDNSYITSSNFINHNSGRLSSTPNVQNLPRKTFEIKTLTGRIIKPSNIRGIFTAPPPFKLFSSDLSQAELRIMADYANDIMMLDYIKRKEDIHWKGCLKIFYGDKNLTFDKKDPEMKRLRKLTKLCNFGGLYGGSNRKKVSSVNEKLELGEPKIDTNIAAVHTEWFNSEFPDIQKYIRIQEEHIEKYGWIDNKFGRRRRLPDAKSKDKYLIAEAKRQGINAQIQGTASEIVQLSIIRISKWLEENQMKSQIIYSVHDELDGYAFPDEIEILKEMIPRMMCEKVFPIDRIKVELESEFEIYDKRWGD